MKLLAPVCTATLAAIAVASALTSAACHPRDRSDWRTPAGIGPGGSSGGDRTLDGGSLGDGDDAPGALPRSPGDGGARSPSPLPPAIQPSSSDIHL